MSAEDANSATFNANANNAAQTGKEAQATAFFNALRDRDDKTARSILNAGMDPDTLSPDSSIPAYCYALWVGSKLAEDLIAAGANTTLADKSGRTPLHWAARNGGGKSIKLAIRHQKDINAIDRNGYTPLHLAAGHGNTANACVLIHHGADTGITDREGLTALQGAREEGQHRTADKMQELICLRHARKAILPAIRRRKKSATSPTP